MEDIDKILKSLRKKSLLNNSSSLEVCSWEREGIKKLIPHREPFLLIDRITHIDRENRIIVGEYTVSSTDPIVQGHFPSFPVYPGALQLEITGQLALCLPYLLNNDITIPPTEDQELNIRATKVLGAYYLSPLLPEIKATVIAQQLGEEDSFLAQMIGQIIIEDKVVMSCAQEVCFID